jgi:hypothetical protein
MYVRVLAGLICLLGVPTSANAQSLKGETFSATDSEAIVLIEEKDGMRDGTVGFQFVDLDQMKVLKRKFGIKKVAWFGHRLVTSYPELKTISGIYKTNASRFSGTKQAAGLVALTSYSFPSSFGGRDGRGCLPTGFPVYRLKPGVANLIDAAILPPEGPSEGLKLLGLIKLFPKPGFKVSGRDEAIADARRILSEYAGIKAEVAPAELVGLYTFKTKKGKSDGCAYTQDIMPAELQISTP